ncbi:MAG: hypothetical protein JSW62_05155 [Thermoplasmatales archaeon]|nr:MAG: hypothetical protein JSW62_05155 [Thermoplasmatales archaeon]
MKNDVKKLEKELSGLPDDYIIILETNADSSFEMSMASIRFLADKNDFGIIVSVNRPYKNLVSMYEKNDIDISKMFVLDCVSKSLNGEMEADNVVFIENVSALTDISLSVNNYLNSAEGKKFVFFDSITTMLIHNKPYVFARFVHSILTKMRLNGVGGLLVSLQDKTNREIRAEIAQLCDKVIQI